jgi:formate dehydrogenase beta subunit
MDRREFLRRTLTLTGCSLIGRSTDAGAFELSSKNTSGYGVLVDTTSCIGCRRCEWACNEWNRNPNKPLKSFEEKKVFEQIRRTHAETFTVVNRYSASKGQNPVYVKKQCMHCEDPACLSACFVHAFQKDSCGAVVYNPDVCVGCRYCMVACPFDIPAYEYDEPITPRVMKCTFCFDRITKEGHVPACVKMCPTETLRFGKREDLIRLAHERIMKNPRKYVNHLYGEHEVGGTSWLYLSGVPFDQIGFRTDIGKRPIPDTSKGYLFTVKTFEIIAAWPLVFGAFYALSRLRRKRGTEDPAGPKKKGGGDEKGK